MSKYFSLLLFLVFVSQLYGQSRRQIFDGPYIKRINDTYEFNWIEKGRSKQQILKIGKDSIWHRQGLPKINTNELHVVPETRWEYQGVHKFAAISDVHGQFELMKRILRRQGITDSLDRWAYDNGHLVVLGDIFDRGDKVTECLWYIFGLQKQAERAGGKLHYLVGNHELMVLHDDLKYSHFKYQEVDEIMRGGYSSFFAKETVLGSWIRSRNTVIKINGHVFVHAGLSRDLLAFGKDIEDINQDFRNRIFPGSYISEVEGDWLSGLYHSFGPLWYRGYAYPKRFRREDAEYVLDQLNAESVIVGHTSMPKLTSFYDNKIILIDSSIKFGKSGEILLFENGEFLRGHVSGERYRLSSEYNDTASNSVFDYLYNVAGNKLQLNLRFDFDSLMANKMQEEYIDAELEILESNEELYTLECKLRTRGNMRKKLCTLPPLKLDFKKKELRYNGFASFDDLKLVLQCLENQESAYHTMKEFLVYKLYNIVDTTSLRVKAVDLDFIDKRDSIRSYFSFILEDEDLMAARLNASLIETDSLTQDALMRDVYLKMVFFQFMIANNDWSIWSGHNLRFLRLPQFNRLYPVPYDFDYCGLVNQKYEMSESAFGRVDMNNRKLILKSITQAELKYMIRFYNGIRKDLYRVCDQAYYLPSSERRKVKEAIESFYKIINSRKRRNIYLPAN